MLLTRDSDYRIQRLVRTTLTTHTQQHVCVVCNTYEVPRSTDTCPTCYHYHLNSLFTAPATTSYIPPQRKAYTDYIPSIHPLVYSPRSHKSVPTLHEHTIVCRNRKCQPTTRDRNYHYVTYTTKLSNNPSHCPSCSTSRIQSRLYDYPDTITTTHMYFNRALAITCLDELNIHNQNRHTSKQLTIEDYLRMAKIRSHTPVSHGICPLHVSCSSCGGTFNIVRTIPSSHVPPTYCIWCGQASSITVTQYNTEEVAAYVLAESFQQESFTQLASVYKVPVVLVQALYNMWETDSHEPFFSAYMQQDEVQQILRKVQK